MQALPAVSFRVAVTGNVEIKSLLFDELQTKLRGLCQPAYRARQIMDWLYKKRAGAFEEMSDLPRTLRARLAENFPFGKLDVVRVLGSRDTTRKFLFRLGDGNLIESVLIPASPALYGQRSDRRTACVSRDEDVSERSSSQSAAPVPGEKIPGEGTYAPGAAGSSGSVRW